MPSRILRLWNPNTTAWEEVGDSRLTAHLAAADPHPQYLTAAELPPGADVTVTTDASLTATESPANTFALAVRLSPDAGNALSLHANGLYGTDTTGGAGGGLATDPLADAKGDVFAASGNDAVGRLPLGTNGHVLTADSTQALGVRWAAPSGGGGLDQATADTLYVNVTGDTVTGALTLQGATATTNVLQARLSTDTQPRFRFDTAGKLDWGAGGATAPDVSLNRTSGDLQITGGGLLPFTTNVGNLGTTTRRWALVSATRLDAADDAGGHIRIGTSNLAAAGQVRLRNAASIAWRNAGNTADLALTVDATDQLLFNGSPIGAGGAYLPLAGGTLTGDLVLSEPTPTVSLKQAADTQPRSRLSDTALAFGPGGSTATDTTLQRTGAGLLGLTGAWHAPSGTWDVKTGTAPGTTRMSLAQNGTLILTPDAGAVALTGGAGSYFDIGEAASRNLRLYGYSVQFGANPGASVGPISDNSLSSGAPSAKWSVVYAAQGTINTSSREAKEAITPLDPAQAMAAVRGTVPVTFDYRPPERGAEWYDLPDDPEQAEQVLLQRLTAAPLEAGARHQAGFVLDSPEFPCDPLFQTGDGQSNAANSVGILLAALQYESTAREALEQRVAALEGA
jgi:hypothetical protein